MMKRLTAIRWIAPAVLALVVACSGGTGLGTDPDEAVLDGSAELVLALGDDVRVSGTVLRLGVAGLIGDSRCPVDAVCVWEGDVEIEIGVALGTGPTFPVRIHSNASAGPTSTEQGSYRVTLVGVEPAPQSTVEIDSDDYRFRFRVEEIG